MSYCRNILLYQLSSNFRCKINELYNDHENIATHTFYNRTETQTIEKRSHVCICSCRLGRRGDSRDAAASAASAATAGPGFSAPTSHCAS